MNPKIVHVADLHVDNRSADQRVPGEAVGSAELSARRCLEQVVRVVEEHDAVLCIAGDVWMNGKPSAESVAGVADILGHVADRTIVIEGNHDVIGVRSGQRGPLHLLASMTPGMRVVTEPGVVEFHGISFGCIPYPTWVSAPARELVEAQQDAVHRQLAEFRQHKVDVIAAHLLCDKAAMHGFRGTEIDMRMLTGDPIISTDDLNDGDWSHVFLGHVHKPQRHGKAVYCGSLDRVSFAEEHDTKTVSVWDVNHMTPVDVVNLPARVLRTVNLDSSDRVPDLDAGDVVRVVLPEGQQRVPQGVAKQFERMGVVVAETRATPKKREHAEVELPRSMALPDLFDVFLERNKVSGETAVRAREALGQVA